MFGSTVLEVVIGLTFCYATVALIVSTLQEALASAFKLRARTLFGGVKTMLNDALARALYAQSLVNPHGEQPSYIEPRDFAAALVDVIQTVPGNYVQLGRDIEALADPHVRRALAGIYQRAGNADQFRPELAAWFESAMDRVSGSYKRRSMMASLLLSLLLAVLFNIDSIHLFQALWLHSPEPPIGWRQFPPAFDAQFVMNVAGWLLTASTALFGAPFWFDLMKKTVQVRGTGVKP